MAFLKIKSCPLYGHAVVCVFRDLFANLNIGQVLIPTQKSL